jgi:hypothetical protein
MKSSCVRAFRRPSWRWELPPPHPRVFEIVEDFANTPGDRRFRPSPSTLVTGWGGRPYSPSNRAVER